MVTEDGFRFDSGDHVIYEGVACRVAYRVDFHGEPTYVLNALPPASGFVAMAPEDTVAQLEEASDGNRQDS